MCSEFIVIRVRVEVLLWWYFEEKTLLGIDEVLDLRGDRQVVDAFEESGVDGSGRVGFHLRSSRRRRSYSPDSATYGPHPMERRRSFA